MNNFNLYRHVRVFFYRRHPEWCPPGKPGAPLKNLTAEWHSPPGEPGELWPSAALKILRCACLPAGMAQDDSGNMILSF